MSNRQISKPTANLMRAKASIEDPANWCQGQIRTKGGRMCAMGALLYKEGKVSIGRDCSFCIKYLHQAAREEAKSLKCLNFGGASPEFVNDCFGHEAVIRMYDKAITLSMQQEAEE